MSLDIVDDAKCWVSADRLSELTGLSVSTIRKYNMLPDTPVIKVGRKCLYDVAEYKQWLRSGGPKQAERNFTEQIRRVHG